MTQTIADLLPAKARAWVYAILSVLVPTVAIAVVLASDGWEWSDAVVIASQVVAFAGFQLARSNTPVDEPPPDLLDRIPAPDAGRITLGELVLVLVAAALIIWIVGAVR